MDKKIIGEFIIDSRRSIVDAMAEIDKNRSGTLFVADDNNLLGAITDGDIRRWILKTGDLKASVSAIMNSNPKYVFEGQEHTAKDFMKANRIRLIPVVDRALRIVDIIGINDLEDDIINDSSNSLKGVPVVIMAGGAGTRLQPYTKILPKPLIPIGDTPIVERIINRFNEYGINEFYMSVNYKKGMIKSYFNDLNPKYNIEYIEEDKPLGTAGSIGLIQKKFDAPIIVSNCDTLIMTDYSSLYKHHIESGNDITVVSALKNITISYGVIHSGVGGKIDTIEEKPKLSFLINTGMYVINPSVIDCIPREKVFHMTDIVERIIQSGGNVGTFPISEDSFLDMGEFSEMKKMEERLNIVCE